MTGLGTLGAQGVRVHSSDAPPGARALLLLGLSSTTWGPFSLPRSLGASGLPGCTLYTSVDLWVWGTVGMGC